MNKQWYEQTENEIRAFFDVDPSVGLSHQEALKRLSRFGSNNDPRLGSVQQRFLRVTVLRQGRRDYIQFKQLVPGDVVLLRQGDRVPADIRLIHVDLLAVDQNWLTGEVLPVRKNTFPVKGQHEPRAQKCIAFAGSFVAGGSGVGIVVERGTKTLLTGSPKKHIAKIGLRGSVIARRLKRFGVIVQQKRALGLFRKIDTLVIDADIKEAEIIEIIRKVQLTRNVDCKFSISSKTSAEQLAGELNVTLFDAKSKQGDLFGCQIVTNLDGENSLWLAKQLSLAKRRVLWVSDGIHSTNAFKAATISFVYGMEGRDDMLLAADIVAPKARVDILTRILYNKK